MLSNGSRHYFIKKKVFSFKLFLPQMKEHYTQKSIQHKHKTNISRVINFTAQLYSIFTIFEYFYSAEQISNPYNFNNMLPIGLTHKNKTRSFVQNGHRQLVLYMIWPTISYSCSIVRTCCVNANLFMILLYPYMHFIVIRNE